MGSVKAKCRQSPNLPPRINFILLGHKSLSVPVRSGERGLSPLRIENKTGYQLQQIFRVMIRKPEWAASALSGCCSMSAKPDQHEKQAGQPLAFLGQDQETQKKL
jgi:hypothetical protein